jgi:hypothetical protein
MIMMHWQESSRGNPAPYTSSKASLATDANNGTTPGQRYIEQCHKRLARTAAHAEPGFY